MGVTASRQKTAQAPPACTQKLDLLDFTGAAVDEAGYITDATGYPMTVDLPKQKRSYRTKYTDEDARILAIWLDRAAAQGISLKGPKFWQILERTNPRHTSTSWNSYWRDTFSDITIDRKEDTRPLQRQCFLSQIDRNLHRHLSPVDDEASGHDCNSIGLADVREDLPNLTSVPTPEPAVNLAAVATQSGVDTPATPLPLQSLQAAQSLAFDKTANNSEEGLIKVLGLQSRADLATWLSQDWVVDAYQEYYQVAIHEWRLAMEAFQAKGEPTPIPVRRSRQKFLVAHSADALCARNPRYIATVARKDHWTADDHDIRFIVRIVDEGRAPGRCWEGHGRAEHTTSLCHTAYRLMCWLHAMARIVNATTSMGRWRKKQAIHWFKFLCRIRRERSVFLQGHNITTTTTTTTTTVTPIPPAADAAPVSIDVSQYLDPAGGLLLPASNSLAERSSPTLRITDAIPSESYTNPPEVAASSHSPLRATGYGPLCDLHVVPTTTVQPGSEDPQALSRPLEYRSNTQTADCILGLQRTVCSPDAIFNGHDPRSNVAHQQPVDDYDVPSLPPYRPLRSKRGLNQAHGIEWSLGIGKNHFDSRHEVLLRRFGVTVDHASTCVLVPAQLYGGDMLSFMDVFSYDKCPKGDDRLTFSMYRHNVLYARAAAWFNSREWPRSGASYDNFMGIDEFRPKDGSHLCHHSTCVNQNHLTYEDTDINIRRLRCVTVAQGVRQLGIPLPEHCTAHEPPCLMQCAALTGFETFLIQFSILRQANGLPAIPAPPKPPNHTYPTFEHQLPLSFPGATLSVNPAQLVRSESPSSISTITTPAIHCRFCPTMHSFRRVTAIWCHIRDKHHSICTQERLQEIVQIGDQWREYWELQQQRGHRINRQHATWIKLEQIKDGGFDWNTILAWKITYSKPKRVAECEFLNADESEESDENLII